MILYLGSSKDRVYDRFVEELKRSATPFAVVDEDQAGHYRVEAGSDSWRIRGGDCQGRRPVGSVFVRHAVARTLDPRIVAPMSRLQGDLNRMLLEVSCTVVNPPSKAYSNYSKPFQLRLLAEAGFDVPRTVVTNVPEEALRFHTQLDGRVILKGVSNMMSFAQTWKEEHFRRVHLLPNSPTQFQEFVQGVDYRVHIVGNATFVTRLVARNEDYRRSALADKEDIVAEPACLPAAVLERSLRLTRSLGLVVGGLDFKESAAGRLVALELNPFPQFTFYESRSEQPISQAIVEYLIHHEVEATNLFA